MNMGVSVQSLLSIFFIVAALGLNCSMRALHCGIWAFFSCSVMASLAVAHGFSFCGTQA